MTLDRAKYFLHHQTQQDLVPFRVMGVEEVCEFLWSGAHSVMNEFMHKGFDVETDVEVLGVLHALQEELKKDKYLQAPALIQACMLKSRRWRRDSSVVRDAYAELGRTKQKNCYMAIADLLSLYALTKTWFLPSEYRPFRSKPVPIHTYDIPCSCACTYRIHEGCSVVAEDLTMHYGTPAALPPTPCVNGHYYVGEPAVASLEEAQWRSLSDAQRLEESNRVICSQPKTYPASFLWYQLSYWFEQESTEPSRVLVMC